MEPEAVIASGIASMMFDFLKAVVQGCWSLGVVAG